LPIAILERLAPRYDGVVEDIYRAGSGLHSWLRPIEQIADIFDAWAVQLLGVNKQTRVMSFSFESGSAPPAAPIEYLRHYHRIDPRLAKVLPAPAGEWIACEEHFDDAFVSGHPFYQDYLIPLGGRYLYGTKLHDDESATVLLGHLSRVGNPPLTAPEKEAFRRLSAHFQKALDIRKTLDASSSRHSVGAGLLEKLRQPMLLIDNERRITYRNHAARALLGRRDIVYESEGLLACRDSDSDLDLTIAIRSLGLVPISTHGDQVDTQERRVVRLKRRDGAKVAGTLIALRPESTMGSFGRVPQALFTVFEPGAPVDIDPFVLSATFDLTPAEARVAAAIVAGGSPEQCARDLSVKVSTVRSQLVAIYRKTGATGQADLVRLILSATTL
jgi:DNA-binding CsgD family transcriptional regulator/PAS domain-containing protein